MMVVCACAWSGAPRARPELSACSGAGFRALASPDECHSSDSRGLACVSDGNVEVDRCEGRAADTTVGVTCRRAPDLETAVDPDC